MFQKVLLKCCCSLLKANKNRLKQIAINLFIKVHQYIKMTKMSDSSADKFMTIACIRTLLMMFNVLFWLCGFSLIFMGIWLKTDYLNFLRISANYWEHAPVLLISLGIINLLVTTLGCACIVRPNPSMLVIYGFYLITMIFVLVSTSIYVSAYKDVAVAGVSQGLQREMQIYIKTPAKERKNLPIDFVQNKLQCCGDSSYLDWSTAKGLPTSCCWTQNDGARKCSRKEPKYVHGVGCASKLRHLLNTDLTTVGVAISAIAFIPLFGTVFAFALASLGSKVLQYERIL